MDKETEQVSKNSIGRGERRGNRLLMLVLGLAVASIGAFWVAQPGVASADDEPSIKCSGAVTADKDSIFDDAYNYSFGCNQDVYSISLVGNRQIDSFSTEVVGIQPDGEPGDSEDFFCVGAVPAFGFGCYASPGKDPAIKLSAGNKLQGKFTFAKPSCDANVQPQIMGVAMVGYQSINDLSDPPSIRKWMATTEPFVLDTSAIRCKVLNPKAKAREICAKVGKAKSRKAKATAKRKCAKAKAAVRAA